MNKKIEGVIEGLRITFINCTDKPYCSECLQIEEAINLIQEMQKELEVLTDKLNLCASVKEAHKKARGKLEIENHKLRKKDKG